MNKQQASEINKRVIERCRIEGVMPMDGGSKITEFFTEEFKKVPADELPEIAAHFAAEVSVLAALIARKMMRV